MGGGGGEVEGGGRSVSGGRESSADLSRQLIRAFENGDLGKVKYLVEERRGSTRRPALV